MVSNMLYFHPFLGRWSNLTNIFQLGWNHQLVFDDHSVTRTCFFLRRKCVSPTPTMLFFGRCRRRFDAVPKNLSRHLGPKKCIERLEIFGILKIIWNHPPFPIFPYRMVTPNPLGGVFWNPSLYFFLGVMILGENMWSWHMHLNML